LAVCRFIRDDFMGFVVEALPAVLLLAGDDEDPLACRGFAKPGSVECRDVAQAGLRGREQAQVGDVTPLSSAGATGGLAKDHDVLGHCRGNIQEQPDAAFAVGDG
jgi:hypothetical protein